MLCFTLNALAFVVFIVFNLEDNKRALFSSWLTLDEMQDKGERYWEKQEYANKLRILNSIIKW